MTIDIDRQFDTAVTELVLDVGQGLPVLDQQAGESVSQVVESDPPQPCLLHPPGVSI